MSVHRTGTKRISRIFAAAAAGLVCLLLSGGSRALAAYEVPQAGQVQAVRVTVAEQPLPLSAAARQEAPTPTPDPAAPDTQEDVPNQLGYWFLQIVSVGVIVYSVASHKPKKKE